MSDNACVELTASMAMSAIALVNEYIELPPLTRVSEIGDPCGASSAMVDDTDGADGRPEGALKFSEWDTWSGAHARLLRR
jgi:hypothetical protein